MCCGSLCCFGLFNRLDDDDLCMYCKIEKFFFESTFFL